MKLELKNISKTYGGVKIIENMSLRVAEGELFSILGVSGSGKTTILKIIAGLIAPDEGRVFVDGVDITALAAEDRGIPYVFQAPFLFPHMKVAKNIAFGLEVKGWPRSRVKEKVQQLLHFLRIEDLAERLPSQLSGGQQQRVAIGRALAPESPIILMDEPFSSLDHDLRLEMGILLKKIQKEWQQTIVFVTHDRQEGMLLSDQMALLLKGKIAQCGNPTHIYNEPLTSELALFMGQSNFIPGIITREVFQSPLGDLPAPGEEDGLAQLFYRPHQLTVDAQGTGFHVLESQGSPREQKIIIEKEGVQILIETFSKDCITMGSEVGLGLPKGKLHFIRK